MLEIREVLPNPVGADKGGEYVVLFNNSSQTISVAGWQLRNAKGKVSSLGSFSVKPSNTLRVDSSALPGALNNTKDSLTLLSPSGQIIDSFTYDAPVAEGIPLLHAQAMTAEVRALLFDQFTPHEVQTSSPYGSVVLLASFVAVILAGVAMYVIKKIKKDTPSL